MFGIQATLDSLYPNPRIPLTHANNFEFLCAVVLSAQSTDKKACAPPDSRWLDACPQAARPPPRLPQVNEITPALFAAAPTPAAMAALSVDRIQAR